MESGLAGWPPGSDRGRACRVRAPREEVRGWHRQRRGHAPGRLRSDPVRGEVVGRDSHQPGAPAPDPGAARPGTIDAGHGGSTLMRIGSEGDHIVGARTRGAIDSLTFAHEQGLDGVFFKGILDVSPTLDLGELREAKAHADSLGLYLEAGVGRINPYNTAESPAVRKLGGGDYRRAMVKMIE